MNFFRRGITSVIRKTGKTAILLVLVFILGNVIAGAISIEQAVKNTEINIRKGMGAFATTEIDYDKLSGKLDFDYNKMEMLSTEAIDKIGKLSYVKYYDYTSNMSLQSKNLKRYQNENSNNGGVIISPFNSVTKTSDEETEGYFSIKGGQSSEPMDLKENKIKLVAGRIFTEEEMNSNANLVLISKKVAELNNLVVGSSITLYSNIYSSDGVIGRDLLPTFPNIGLNEPASVKEFEFQVIGIFEPQKTTETNEKGEVDFNYLDEEKENTFYTSNKVVKNINDVLMAETKEVNPDIEYQESQDYFVPLFVLEDPIDLPKFREEAKQFMPDYYKITDNSSLFEQVSAPMKNMEWIASIVLYVACGATLIILSLLITLFLRDRKHEIGIYLSLGEKRTKVIGQILIEVVLISFIAITLSLFTGNLIANGMSKQMLNNQIISEQEKGNNDAGISYDPFKWMGYGSEVTTDDLVEAYVVSLGLGTVLMFYFVGLGTIFVSTIIPILYIVRLNPKKIMM